MGKKNYAAQYLDMSMVRRSKQYLTRKKKLVCVPGDKLCFDESALMAVLSDNDENIIMIHSHAKAGNFAAYTVKSVSSDGNSVTFEEVQIFNSVDLGGDEVFIPVKYFLKG